MRVDHKKDRWGEISPLGRAMGCEFTMRKSDGVRVHHQKKSDGVRVHHQKEQWGESSP